MYFPDIGYNAVVRQIVDVFIRNVEAQVNQTAEPIKPGNLDVGDLINATANERPE